jgi:fructose-1,6-bisphosphatase I
MATNGNGDMAPVQNEKVNIDIVTLTRFLTEEQAKHKEATGDFTYVYRRYWEYC